jgi:hypothetical protein
MHSISDNIIKKEEKKDKKEDSFIIYPSFD